MKRIWLVLARDGTVYSAYPGDDWPLAAWQADSIGGKEVERFVSAFQWYCLAAGANPAELGLS